MIRRGLKGLRYRPEIAGSRVAFAGIDTPVPPDGPTVLQAIRTYLPRTENWIYEQVRHVQKFRSVFAAKATVTTDAFPFEPLYTLSRSSLTAQLLDRPIRRRLGYSPYFASVAVKESARIIHAHGGGIATFLAGTAQELGLPMVVSFYGVDMWNHPDGVEGLRRKYASTFRVGSLFLAEGPAAAEQLAQIGGPSARIIVHRLGVDVEAIRFKPRELSNGEKLKVLMASRFVEKKGIPYGVEAFCRVARDHHGIHLTIVGDSGSSKDAVMKREILSIARGYGVSGQVTILGFMGREALNRLALDHHILLHPSVKASSGDSEGGHPVVMPMLAGGGMPILATWHCDIPEVVENEKTGWLVRERDADEIESVLRRIVADPGDLPKFGQEARKLVEEKYDIRRMRLDTVYERVLNDNTKVPA